MIAYSKIKAGDVLWDWATKRRDSGNGWWVKVISLTPGNTTTLRPGAYVSWNNNPQKWWDKEKLEKLCTKESMKKSTQRYEAKQAARRAAWRSAR